MWKTEIKRAPARSWKEDKEVQDFLKSAFTCQIAFSEHGLPYVLPMFYVLYNQKIVIHGSKGSRLINALKRQKKVCVSIMEEDGLVLAKSAFHHSMNYRSVMIFGQFQNIDQKQEIEAISKYMVEKMEEGRWQKIRPPSPEEYAQTEFLGLEVEHLTAKSRRGGPIDAERDKDSDIDTGVIPIRKQFCSRI